MRYIGRVVSVLLLVAGATACRRAPAGGVSAPASDAVGVIASLLDSTRILAIGERRGWEEERQFLLSGAARVLLGQPPIYP